MLQLQTLTNKKFIMQLRNLPQLKELELTLLKLIVLARALHLIAILYSSLHFQCNFIIYQAKNPTKETKNKNNKKFLHTHKFDT